MRHRIKDYSVNGQVITLTAPKKHTTIEDLRLIVNETQGEVLLSSTDKHWTGDANSISIENQYDATGTILEAVYISIPESVLKLEDTDQLTIECDYGDDLDEVAKEATSASILSAINGIATSMYKGVPIVSQTGDATIAPNVWNVWESVVGTLRISKGAAIEGVVNNYMLRFNVTGSAAVVFTGFSLKWYGGVSPTWTAGYTYEISIIDDVALWAETA